MKTTVINIFGSPGSGKSTLAAELYAEMKKQGKSVELVRECIKKWAWTGHKPTVFEQIYITNEQMLEETALYGKVQYLITDSPLVLGNFYCNYYHKSLALQDLDTWIKREAAGRLQLINDPIDFFVPVESSVYKEEGRYSSLEESRKIEKELIEFITPVLGDPIKLDKLPTRCQDALKIILP